MLLAHQTGKPAVIAGVARIVVIADLSFTTTAVILQRMEMKMRLAEAPLAANAPLTP